MNIVIIGGGPAGLAAAYKGARSGAGVTLIENNLLGGTCLNVGCIPTKSLLTSAKVVHKLRKTEELGIKIKDFQIDLPRMMQRKEEVINTLKKGMQTSLRALKVNLVTGTVRFISRDKVVVEAEGKETKEVSFDKMAIATGSVPIKLPGIDYSHPGVLTSEKALSLARIPSKLLIIGGGTIGCEFACLFHALGTEVTLVEKMPQLLPGQDKNISNYLGRSFKGRGIVIRTGTTVSGIDMESDESLGVHLSNDEDIFVEKILVCTGRQPNIQSLNLNVSDIKMEGESISVNDKMETSVPNIYAAGDVTGRMLLAHVATAQGEVAAENATGGNRKMEYDIVPLLVYTWPEVASVGLDSEAAQERGHGVKVKRYHFLSSSRAQTSGETEGFIQIVCEEGSGKLLGAQIIGDEATELIHELALAIRAGMRKEELSWMIFGHPTLSEGIKYVCER